MTFSNLSGLSILIFIKGKRVKLLDQSEFLSNFFTNLQLDFYIRFLTQTDIRTVYILNWTQPDLQTIDIHLCFYNLCKMFETNNNGNKC